MKLEEIVEVCRRVGGTIGEAIASYAGGNGMLGKAVGNCIGALIGAGLGSVAEMVKAASGQ